MKEKKIKCTCGGSMILCANGEVVCPVCGQVSEKYIFSDGEIYEC